LKLVALLAVVAAALTATGQAGARHYVPHKPFGQMTPAEIETWHSRQATHARGAVAWLEQHIEAATKPRRLESSPLVVLRSHLPDWRRELRWYRSSLRINTERLDELRLARLATSGDWMGYAVPFADRVFPGTGGWLDDCSASEGGHGAWVPNRQGLPPGGWMQFYASTFYDNVDDAFAEARRRGFDVPDSARSWYSPVGQAVTAAYIVTRYGSGAWTGSGC
jgi:hypothetical protein